MTPTWQRIIKAGKGILEIAREREVFDYVKLTDKIAIHLYPNEKNTNNYDLGWAQWHVGDTYMYIKLINTGTTILEIDALGLDHLEGIAQAFEEALEIWRKM